MTSTTTIDLAPVLLQIVLPIAGAVLSALIPLAVAKLATFLHLKANSEDRKALLDAADNAVALALKAARDNAGGAVVDVHNASVAAAVDYLTTNLPDAIKRLGLTPDAVENIVNARLAAAEPTPAPNPAPPKGN